MTEQRRRQSLEDALLAYILAHPRSWLHGRDMRPSGGDAWRSRLVNVRARLAERGLAFVWNGKNGIQAAYQVQPLRTPLAERAPQAQAGLFE